MSAGEPQATFSQWRSPDCAAFFVLHLALELFLDILSLPAIQRIHPLS